MFGLLLIPILFGMAYLKAPANKVWAGGTPEEFCVVRAKVKTVTNLRAGVYVIKDTTDDEIAAAGAAATNVYGVLTERNWTNPDWDPTTAPAVGDEIDVILVGTGAICKVRNGANLAQGVLINTSATGRAAAAAVAAAGDFAKVVGKTLFDHDGSGAEGDILVVV